MELFSGIIVTLITTAIITIWNKLMRCIKEKNRTPLFEEEFIRTQIEKDSIQINIVRNDGKVEKVPVIVCFGLKETQHVMLLYTRDKGKYKEFIECILAQVVIEDGKGYLTNVNDQDYALALEVLNDFVRFESECEIRDLNSNTNISEKLLMEKIYFTELSEEINYSWKIE